MWRYDSSRFVEQPQCGEQQQRGVGPVRPLPGQRHHDHQQASQQQETASSGGQPPARHTEAGAERPPVQEECDGSEERDHVEEGQTVLESEVECAGEWGGQEEVAVRHQLHPGPGSLQEEGQHLTQPPDLRQGQCPVRGGLHGPVGETHHDE